MLRRIFGDNLYFTPAMDLLAASGPHFVGPQQVVQQLVSPTALDPKAVCQQVGLGDIPIGAAFGVVDSYLETAKTAAGLAQFGETTQVRALHEAAKLAAATHRLPLHQPFFDGQLHTSVAAFSNREGLLASARAILLPRAPATPQVDFRDPTTAESRGLMTNIMQEFVQRRGGRADPELITNHGFVKGAPETNLLMIDIIRGQVRDCDLKTLYLLMCFFSDLCMKGTRTGGGVTILFEHGSNTLAEKQALVSLRTELAARLYAEYTENPATGKTNHYASLVARLSERLSGASESSIKANPEKYLGQVEQLKNPA